MLLAQNRGIGVHYKIDANVPDWVMTDECRLTQIMLNLGSNAVQYTASVDKAAVGGAGKRENGEGTSPVPYKRMNIDLELSYFPEIKSINMRIRDTGAIYYDFHHQSSSTLLHSIAIERYFGHRCNYTY